MKRVLSNWGTIFFKARNDSLIAKFRTNFRVASPLKFLTQSSHDQAISLLICIALQSTGFYIIGTLPLNESDKTYPHFWSINSIAPVPRKLTISSHIISGALWTGMSTFHNAEPLLSEPWHANGPKESIISITWKTKGIRNSEWWNTTEHTYKTERTSEIENVTKRCQEN